MTHLSIWQQAGRLFFLLLLVFTIGYVGSGFMNMKTRLWYDALIKSPMTPPGFVFPIVWTALLFLQAIAAFIVWGKVSPRWFVVQLMLNMAWSFTFFYLHNPMAAFVISLLFSIAVFLNMITFYGANKWAGILIFPTFLWSLFAIYLNGYIVF